MRFIILGSAILLPACSFAASAPQDFAEFIGMIVGLLKLVLPILVLLAGIYFVWGVALFIFHVGGDEKSVESGKAIMMWGLFALFIMASVWAIVLLVSNEFGWSSLGLPFLRGK